MWFKKKKKQAASEKAISDRVESIKKKMDSSDEIIEMMKNFDVERRVVNMAFEGPDRRHA